MFEGECTFLWIVWRNNLLCRFIVENMVDRIFIRANSGVGKVGLSWYDVGGESLWTCVIDRSWWALGVGYGVFSWF